MTKTQPTIEIPEDTTTTDLPVEAHVVEAVCEVDGRPYQLANGETVMDALRIEKRLLASGERIIAIRVENAVSARFAWCQLELETAEFIGDQVFNFTEDG
jgi:hypothetical protein